MLILLASLSSLKTREQHVKFLSALICVQYILEEESGREAADSSRTLGSSPVESGLVAPVDVSLVGVAFPLQQNLLHKVHLARCCCLVQLGHVASGCHGNARTTQDGARRRPESGAGRFTLGTIGGFRPPCASF